MTDETELPQWEIDFLNEQAARDAVIEAAKAWHAAITDPPGMWASPEDFALIAAVDRLDGTGPPAAPESPPAAVQATPAPQDTPERQEKFRRVKMAAEKLLEASPAGLSAEQEIRARALSMAIRLQLAGTEPVDLYTTADRLVGYIRDGRTPGESDAG